MLYVLHNICMWNIMLVQLQTLWALYCHNRVIFGVFWWFHLLDIIYRYKTSSSSRKNMSLWTTLKIADFSGGHFLWFFCLAVSCMIIWTIFVKHVDVICLLMLVVCKNWPIWAKSDTFLGIGSEPKLHLSGNYTISSLQVVLDKTVCKKHATVKDS